VIFILTQSKVLYVHQARDGNNSNIAVVAYKAIKESDQLWHNEGSWPVAGECAHAYQAPLQDH